MLMALTFDDFINLYFLLSNRTLSIISPPIAKKQNLESQNLIVLNLFSLFGK